MKLYLAKTIEAANTATGQNDGDWCQVGIDTSDIQTFIWTDGAWTAPSEESFFPFHLVDPAYAWVGEYEATLKGYAEDGNGGRVPINGLPADAIVIP